MPCPWFRFVHIHTMRIQTHQLNIWENVNVNVNVNVHFVTVNRQTFIIIIEILKWNSLAMPNHPIILNSKMILLKGRISFGYVQMTIMINVFVFVTDAWQHFPHTIQLLFCDNVPFSRSIVYQSFLPNQLFDIHIRHSRHQNGYKKRETKK